MIEKLKFRSFKTDYNNREVHIVLNSLQYFKFSLFTKSLYKIKLIQKVDSNYYFVLKQRNFLSLFFRIGDYISCYIDNGYGTILHSELNENNNTSFLEEININEYYFLKGYSQFRNDIFFEAIDLFWKKSLNFKDYWEYSRSNPSPIMFSMESSSWGFRLSDTFTKNIKKIDKKLQGRILESLSKISANPKESIGDTIKPLTGDLNGIWRYRIGDYRLLYFPLDNEKIIELISFESRGSVYEN